jgi:hypothetical protein
LGGSCRRLRCCLPFFLCEFELFDYFAQFAHLPLFEVAAFVPVCGCDELEEL